MAKLKRKAFNVPGHAHELTFSCYRRRPFFANDEVKELFLESLDKARQTHNLLVWAYVVMPEHVHVVVRPLDEKYDVSAILKSIKQPVGRIAVARAKRIGDESRFSVVKSNDSSEHRFWQVGGGYDRNLHTAKAIWASIGYIHMNPVNRGLVEKPEDYEWSSYNAYEGAEEVPFKVDRCEVWLS